jgi:hypothetical protein
MYKRYINYDVVIHLERRGKDQDAVYCPFVYFCMIDYLFALQVKNDSHKLILKFGTVANNYVH